MANVLASVAGTYGFLEAMGKNGGVGTLTTELESNSGVGRMADHFEPFHSKSSAPVTLTWAGRSNAFIIFTIPYKAVYTFSPSISWGKGYPHKQLCFYNDAGKLMFSIGLFPNNTTTAWSSGDGYPSNTEGMTPYIFFYGDASTTVPTSYEKLTGLPYIPGNVDGVATGGAWQNSYGGLSVNYVWDATTPTNSKLEIKWRGITYSVSSLSTKLQVTSKLIAKLTMGEAVVSTGNNNNYYGGGLVKSVVVADGVDYSLTAKCIYPSAFGPNNAFSGAIASVNTPKQDTTYVSSSAEVSSIAEFELADLASIGTLDVIYKVDLFAFLRYVQSGGTSIQFTCALTDQSGNVHASTIVTVAANETETQCRTNKVLSSLVSALTSQNYTLAQIQAMRVRVSI